MHIFDIVFLIFASIFVLIGIKRGFIGEIIRLIAMISGFFIAFFYYKDIAGLFNFLKAPSNIKNGFAFVLIYIVVVLGLIIVGWFIKKLIHLVFLGWLDRLLGAGIGFIKVVFLFWALCLSISSFENSSKISIPINSIVYKTFKGLPSLLKLNSLTKTRDTLKKIYSSDKIQKNKKMIQEIKIPEIITDSSKNSKDK
ncbi:MAG: CvpA family protein [Fibrobacter sp.]|nr:CvpA family protein [Fibrobacter sp.]